MIEFQRITTKDVTLYNYMEQLMVTSSLSEEYRPLEELHNYTDTKAHFYCNIILHHDAPAGFIAYRDFRHFYHVEHFVINPSLRNRGHGKNTLNRLRQQLNRPIILGVEMPEEEMVIRRINSYKRHDLISWEKSYVQPSYKVGSDYLPMLLAAHGNLECEGDFEQVEKCIYRKVYKTK